MARPKPPRAPYATGKTRSPLEDAFLTRWRQLAPDYPPPAVGFVFAPPRKWEVDFAWLDVRLAVEIEGGQWVRGRHQRGTGFADDADKYNALMLQGWRLLRFTTSHFDDPHGMIATVLRALEATHD